MSRVPVAPPADIFQIDLAPMKSFLVDLPPGSMLGMRREQEGLPSVVQEITSNQPKYGERAGITATDFNRFGTLSSQYGQILVQLPVVEKAHEVLKESLAHVDNVRHRLATAFADSAEAHARAEGGDSTLLTAYEKTIAYRSVIADKAVRTRKKNEEAKKAQASAKGTSEPAEVTQAMKPAEATQAAKPAEATSDTGKPTERISRIPNAPPNDIFKLDLASLKAVLVDLPPGATVGMRREQDGWEGVVHEVISNQAVLGERAGITATDFNKFVALDQQYDQILAHIPLVEKAEEVLKESLAHIDNLRHRLAAAFADSAESHAKAEGGDPTLLTAYEKTIAYRAVVADKAVKTRKRNEEGKKT